MWNVFNHTAILQATNMKDTCSDIRNCIEDMYPEVDYYSWNEFVKKLHSFF